MPATQEELNAFHEFASEQLRNGGAELSLDELYEQWRLENPTPREQTDIHASIQRGLADVEAGRYEPADKVMRELREKHGIPAE